MHDKFYAVLDTNVLVSALLGASHMSGNIKHFPRKHFVITPAEMVELLEKVHNTTV